MRQRSQVSKNPFQLKSFVAPKSGLQSLPKPNAGLFHPVKSLALSGLLVGCLSFASLYAQTGLVSQAITSPEIPDGISSQISDMDDQVSGKNGDVEPIDLFADTDDQAAEDNTPTSKFAALLPKPTLIIEPIQFPIGEDGISPKPLPGDKLDTNASDKDGAAQTSPKATPDKVKAIKRAFHLLNPVRPSHISSPFGMRHGRRHTGIDIVGKVGTPIYAAGDGKVVFSGWESGYGQTIIIEHPTGQKTLYSHCSKRLVGVGKTVTQGEEIGKIGTTGNTTGPHLHFEVIVHGIPQNPMRYLASSGNNQG
jgi:murein DD-endopeptidase MepM/ murein hydrolase activator NlpD